jgi:hypothetical protein
MKSRGRNSGPLFFARERVGEVEIGILLDNASLKGPLVWLLGSFLVLLSGISIAFNLVWNFRKVN